MAVAFTLVASSHNQLKYKVTSAGAEAGNLDQTTLLADAIPGSPLALALATSIADQAAGRAFAFERDDLDLALLERDVDALWIIDGDTDGASGIRLTMTSAAADALGSYLSITHRHSSIQ